MKKKCKLSEGLLSLQGFFFSFSTVVSKIKNDRLPDVLWRGDWFESFEGAEVMSLSAVVSGPSGPVSSGPAGPSVSSGLADPSVASGPASPSVASGPAGPSVVSRPAGCWHKQLHRSEGNPDDQFGDTGVMRLKTSPRKHLQV